MKTKTSPDRTGSNIAKRARTDCYILAALCLIGAVAAFLSNDFMDFFPGLLGAAILLLLIGTFFRVLGCMAFDLETIASAMDQTDDESDGE